MQRVQVFTRAAALAAACTVGSIAAYAQDPQPRQPAAAKPNQPAAQMSSDDTMFVQKAAEAGMKEVEQGKMAAQKAANTQVKAYANKLVKDHTAANNQLKAIAKRKNIELPASAPSSADAWAGQTGAAFDKGFIDAQVKAHQEAIELFEKEANTGTDAQLKAFAQKQLPGLRAHLKQAQDLQSKLATTTH
jgi:putative membrane protein